MQAQRQRIRPGQWGGLFGLHDGRSPRTSMEERQTARTELRSIKHKSKGKNDCVQRGKTWGTLNFSTKVSWKECLITLCLIERFLLNLHNSSVTSPYQFYWKEGWGKKVWSVDGSSSALAALPTAPLLLTTLKEKGQRDSPSCWASEVAEPGCAEANTPCCLVFSGNTECLPQLNFTLNPQQLLHSTILRISRNCTA